MGGCNAWQDVATVQYLLNCVPASEGGPLKELKIDGIIGPLTIAAIRGFQKTLGQHDGRVDPENKGGRMIASLSSYDPMPETTVVDGFAKGSKGNLSKDYKGSFPFAKGGKSPEIAKGAYEEEDGPYGKGKGDYPPSKGDYREYGKGQYPPGKGGHLDPGKGAYIPGKGTFPDYGKISNPPGKSAFPDYGKGNFPGGKGGGAKGGY
jgi:hypothetical protein